MNFDPAITAWQVFTRVQASQELGEELKAAVAAQERFSSGTGEEASEAYRELVAIGARHPEALVFGEFLVYATWCHLMDETCRSISNAGWSCVARCSSVMPARTPSVSYACARWSNRFAPAWASSLRM